MRKSFLTWLLTVGSAVAGLAADSTCLADGSCQADANNPTTRKPKCEDKNDKCEAWATDGDCISNPGYMNTHCRRSCELCSDQVGDNPVLKFQEMRQAADLGVVQTLHSSKHNVTEFQTSHRIFEARHYLNTAEMDPALSVLCRNEHRMCSVWAVAGECDKNVTFMKKNCAPSCYSCDYLVVENRCPLDPDAQDAWQPGDLDAMFNRLTQEPFRSQFSVDVLSSPAMGNQPWVLTMENVVSEYEANRLIEFGNLAGYKRSGGVGSIRADGTMEQLIDIFRTSSTAWCRHDCYEDDTIAAVMNRLSNITGIDESNSEYLQLLKYEEGQYYDSHNDYIKHQTKRQSGVRILTFYLYLNDVEAGGGTQFDYIGKTVLPKRGRAVLWANVLNNSPNEVDGRTNHRALPVESGIKYGANAWFHMRDFKTPEQNDCL